MGLRGKRARPNRKKGVSLDVGEGDGASEVRSDRRHIGTKSFECSEADSPKRVVPRERNGSSGSEQVSAW